MSAVEVDYTVARPGGRAGRRAVQLAGRHPRDVGPAGRRRWPSATGWSPTTPAATGSRRAPAGPYTLDDLVDDVLALLDRLGVAAGPRRGPLAGRDDRAAAGRPGARAGAPAGGAAAPRRRPDPQGRSWTGRPPSGPTAPASSRRPWPAAGSPRPYAAAHPDLVADAGGDDRRRRRRGLRRLRRGRSRGVDLRADLGRDHARPRWWSRAPRTRRCRRSTSGHRRRHPRAPSCSP